MNPRIVTHNERFMLTAFARWAMAERDLEPEFKSAARHELPAIDDHAGHNTTSIYTPPVMLPLELSTDLTSLSDILLS